MNALLDRLDLREFRMLLLGAGLVITAIAVTATLVSAPTGSYHSSYGYYSAPEDHQIVEPDMLPDSWIDYSGLDFVAISVQTLGRLSVEERAAILKPHCR